VFVPAFTFAATSEVVALAGAVPVFVDVLPDTYNMDPASLEAGIALVKREGKWRSRAVIPVDLFGQPADYRSLEPIARRYNAAFAGSNRIITPRLIEGAVSSWAQYTIQVEDRARFQVDLKAAGVPTAVYYPIPLSRQVAYAQYPSVPIPVSEALSGKVVSLPMHPYLDEASQARVTAAALKSVGR
jgi:dTDP-4-amino-4,6-dideoxygalactose transaminase